MTCEMFYFFCFRSESVHIVFYIYFFLVIVSLGVHFYCISMVNIHTCWWEAHRLDFKYYKSRICTWFFTLTSKNILSMLHMMEQSVKKNSSFVLTNWKPATKIKAVIESLYLKHKFFCSQNWFIFLQILLISPFLCLFSLSCSS